MKKQTHFFSRNYAAFDKLLFSIQNKMFNISSVLVILTALLFSCVNATTMLVILILLLIAAPFLLGRPVAILVILVEIKGWNQVRKDDELLEAVRDNNSINVRVLLWAGADVNKQHLVVIPSSSWNNPRGWTYHDVHPLDISTGKVRNILLKHGAVPCPDQKIYPY